MNKPVKKTMLSFAVLLILFSLFSPASLANNGNGEPVEIELQIGNREVTVNGETMEVAAPYLSNDVTLVPLRVITKAFGAQLGWDQATNTVTLTYGNQTVQLTIGSMTALVNGEETELQTAAELSDGTTMVPLRMVTQTFGASIQYDPATKTITIRGGGSNEPSGETGLIEDGYGNPDNGLAEEEEALVAGDDKEYIGDSYFDWTMKYPVRMTLGFQSETGNWITLWDVDGRFSFSLQVEQDRKNLTERDLLKRLDEEIFSSETVLNKKIVTDAEPSYALIVTEDDTYHYEHRAYYDGENLYVLILSVYDKEDMKDQGLRTLLADFMDSFRMEFTANEKTQDISKFKNGYQEFHDENYGISGTLPAGWEKEYFTNRYSNPDDSLYFEYEMTSIEDGDTLEAWVDRMEAMYAEQVQQEYYEISDRVSITVSGQPALMTTTVLEYEKTLETTVNVYLFRAGYKYRFTIGFLGHIDEEEQEAIVNGIVESIELTDGHESLGYLYDDTIYDLDAVKTYHNETYNYSIEMPEYWGTIPYFSSGALAEFRGGTFLILVEEDQSKDEFMEEMLNEEKKNDSGSDQSLFKSINTIEINGIEMEQFEVNDNENENNYFMVYLFEKDGMAFSILTRLEEPYVTPENVERLETAVESFRFDDSE